MVNLVQSNGTGFLESSYEEFCTHIYLQQIGETTVTSTKRDRGAHSVEVRRNVSFIKDIIAILLRFDDVLDGALLGVDLHPKAVEGHRLLLVLLDPGKQHLLHLLVVEDVRRLLRLEGEAPSL